MKSRSSTSRKEESVMAWLTGFPREEINWSPTIDSVKCLKCGMCMNCGKKVYAWTENGAIVSNPKDCIVGCSTCANLCLGQAISFPDISTVRKVYLKEGIWTKVKSEMEKQGVFDKEE